MLIQIVQGVPLWVWPLFVVLLAAGLAQTRSRRVSRQVVQTVPAVMIALSLFGLVSSFGASLTALAAWAIGVVLAVVVNEGLVRSPRDVRYDSAGKKFEIAGSFVPLSLMMAIFGTRLTGGVLIGLVPAVASDPGFIWLTSTGLDFISGLFLTRAWRALRVARAGTYG